MIAGIANIGDNSEENKHNIQMIAQIMLYHMASYNKDGTGLAIGFTDKTVSYRKTEESGETWSGKVELTKDKDYTNIIMHTRMATQGASTELNAHPFESKYGLLVHNGWCSELYQKYKSELKSQCDTEALAYIFDPEPEIFNALLIGQEHFAIAHLAQDGSNIQLWNKNKNVFKMHSDKIKADVFCTSRSVLTEVLGILQENSTIEYVPENSITMFKDGKVMQEKFAFKDSSPNWYGHSYYGSSYNNPASTSHKTYGYGTGNPPNKFYDYRDYAEWNSRQAQSHGHYIGPTGSTSYNKVPVQKKLSRKEKKRQKKLEMYKSIFKDFLDE